MDSGNRIGPGHCLVSLEDVTEANVLAIENRRHGVISRFHLASMSLALPSLG